MPQRAPGAHGWNTSFLCNHDNPRAVSHFGNDSATLLADGVVQARA